MFVFILDFCSLEHLIVLRFMDACFKKPRAVALPFVVFILARCRRDFFSG